MHTKDYDIDITFDDYTGGKDPRKRFLADVAVYPKNGAAFRSATKQDKIWQPNGKAFQLP